jgi:hypothetical protein
VAVYGCARACAWVCTWLCMGVRACVLAPGLPNVLCCLVGLIAPCRWDFKDQVQNAADLLTRIESPTAGTTAATAGPPNALPAAA